MSVMNQLLPRQCLKSLKVQTKAAVPRHILCYLPSSYAPDVFSNSTLLHAAGRSNVAHTKKVPAAASSIHSVDSRDAHADHNEVYFQTLKAKPPTSICSHFSSEHAAASAEVHFHPPLSETTRNCIALTGPAVDQATWQSLPGQLSHCTSGWIPYDQMDPKGWI